MTGRKGSERAFMSMRAPPRRCWPILNREFPFLRLFRNVHGFLPGLTLELCRAGKAAHPDDFGVTDRYGPQLAFRLRDVALLQQFLNLLGGLGMGRPKSVSSTPVP